MEYYGEKPKRFTKEWWPYFFDYYKWHTLAAIFIIIVAVTSIMQAINAPKYDLSILFAAEEFAPDNLQSALEDSLPTVISDCDQNDDKKIGFMAINLGGAETDMQYAGAMKTKLELELAAGDSFIYIFKRPVAEFYSTSYYFLPVPDWCDISGKVGTSADGTMYGVSLANSKVLKDSGVNSDDLYILIRQIRADELKDEKKVIQFENAKLAAQYLIAE